MLVIGQHGEGMSVRGTILFFRFQNSQKVWGKSSKCFRTLLFNWWFKNQQHWHHLRACQKVRTPRPRPMYFNKIPKVIHAHTGIWEVLLQKTQQGSNILCKVNETIETKQPKQWVNYDWRNKNYYKTFQVQVRKVNREWILSNNMESLLTFSGVITVLWLCRTMFLFWGDARWSIEGNIMIAATS